MLGTLSKKPYDDFILTQQVGWSRGMVTVKAFSVNLSTEGLVMCISTKDGPIYLTKAQARAFFGFPQD